MQRLLSFLAHAPTRLPRVLPHPHLLPRRRILMHAQAILPFAAADRNRFAARAAVGVAGIRT